MRTQEQSNSRADGIVADHVINAENLNCPEPIIQTRKKLKSMGSGETLLVLATDPGAVLDFQAFCRITGNALLEMSEEGEMYVFLLRKS